MHVSIRDARSAQRRPPSSPEAKSAFFLLKTTGLMARSTTFEVYLRAAVVEESLQAIPMVQRVADRFCGRAAARQSCQLLLEPAEQVGDERLASCLSSSAALVRWLSPDRGLDGVERRDAPERLRGNRRRVLLGQVIKFAPYMAPAVDERRALATFRRGQALVDRIAVALQQARVATQQRLGVLRTAAGGVMEHHRRRVAAGPGPVIAGDRPGEPLLGPAPAGVEHRHAGFVGEQPHRGEQDLRNRATTGRTWKAAAPSQPASTSRPISMPCRARPWAWRYNGVWSA